MLGVKYDVFVSCGHESLEMACVFSHFELDSCELVFASHDLEFELCDAIEQTGSERM
jgi:hypothetical protein